VPGAYVGAGATLGPAMTISYLASQRIAATARAAARRAP
jgi:hypothetical protein